ncbi:MAG: hypothetical protein PHW52_04305 [Candidatus Pacebacteria bacterium]|nr:hypothetical protein [Candidatus Paceibacterota bacterium]
MVKIHKRSKNLFGLKIPKKKRRRRKNNYRNLFFSMLGFFVFIFLGGLGVNYVSKSSSSEVKISGIEDNAIKEEDLKNAVNDISKFSYSLLGKEIKIDNFLLSEQKKIEMIMKKFPQIENIELKKDSSKNELILNVKQKEPAFIWCKDKCSLMGGDGSYIKDYQDEEKYNSLPRINDESFVNSDDFRKKILGFVSDIQKPLSEIPNFEKPVYSAHGEKVSVKGQLPCNFIFGFGESDDPMDWQLEKMKIAKKDYFNELEKIDYIDFRDTNTVTICKIEGNCSSIK